MRAVISIESDGHFHYSQTQKSRSEETASISVAFGGTSHKLGNVWRWFGPILGGERETHDQISLIDVYEVSWLCTICTFSHSNVCLFYHSLDLVSDTT